MKLVFCGNCQIDALRRAYMLFVAPHTGHESDYVFHQDVDQPEARAALAGADVIVEQIVPHDRRAPLADAPPTAQRILVPSVGATFLWPYAGTAHPDSARLYGAYHPFNAALGDAWLVRRIKEGTIAGAAEAYLDLDIGRAAHLDRRLEMALDSQATLDRIAGTDFAGLIAQYLRTERLFRTPYHAEARIMQPMLKLVMVQTGAPQAAHDDVETLLRASLYGPKDLPIHPGVAAHFGLQWMTPETLTQFHSETMLTFAEWTGRFLRCEAYPAVSRAVEAVLSRRPTGPALLKEAAPSLPASPLVRYAQAVVQARSGAAAQALPILLALAQDYPDLPQIDASLFDAYAACGRPAEAAAALRREIARTPHIRSLHRQLADFCAETAMR